MLPPRLTSKLHPQSRPGCHTSPRRSHLCLHPCFPTARKAFGLANACSSVVTRPAQPSLTLSLCPGWEWASFLFPKLTAAGVCQSTRGTALQLLLSVSVICHLPSQPLWVPTRCARAQKSWGSSLAEWMGEWLNALPCPTVPTAQSLLPHWHPQMGLALSALLVLLTAVFHVYLNPTVTVCTKAHPDQDQQWDQGIESKLPWARHFAFFSIHNSNAK